MNTPKKILVVDDDQVNREFFPLMLSKLGFTVAEAADGVDALEKLPDFHPDLILLDNVMPRMDGFELTKRLKNDPRYREIPIIMFSALDDVQDKLVGFELGIEDYITKPFNFTEVLARIKAALRNHELFSQIVVRDSRLNIAESLSHDIKQSLPDLIRHIDELDSDVARIPDDLAGAIRKETQNIRRCIAGLDTRIDKTLLEWESLKKNEIGLSVLEDHIRKILHQEHHK
jgi:DNA-binding response OmpR family regulator